MIVNSVNDKKTYLNYIAYLRGVMVLFVVLGHALTIFVSDYAGHEMIESVFGSTLRTIIYSFHMPVFMAISGYLFFFEVQNAMKNSLFDGFGKFVIKKVKRLLIPFILIFYFWRKPLLYLANPTIYDGMTVSQTTKNYLSVSTTGALWFLYVLFIIFILQRLLVKIIWKDNISLFIFLALFSFISVLSYKLSGPVHHVMLYNIYFMIGCAIHKFEDEFKKVFLPAIVFLAVIGTVIIIFVRPTGFAGALISFVTALFDIYIAFELSKKTEHLFKKPISIISDLSMGIYLFHEPIIFVIGSMLPKFWGGILTFTFVITGLLISMGMTVLIRRLKLEFVIGE